MRKMTMTRMIATKIQTQIGTFMSHLYPNDGY